MLIMAVMRMVEKTTMEMENQIHGIQTKMVKMTHGIQMEMEMQIAMTKMIMAS